VLRVAQEYGKANPHAPPELSRFAFLIGKWHGPAKLLSDDGTREELQTTWEGRYVLDGYAIADEYRMRSPAGELLVLGMNFRAYDLKQKTWNMKWLNALGGTWVDLGSEEQGGVKADEKEITYIIREPVATQPDAYLRAHLFTRATYTNVSESHFTWRGERSNDRKSWQEFLVVELYRNAE
jgi:hypothetical protein